MKLFLAISNSKSLVSQRSLTKYLITHLLFDKFFFPFSPFQFSCFQTFKKNISLTCRHKFRKKMTKLQFTATWVIQQVFHKRCQTNSSFFIFLPPLVAQAIPCNLLKIIIFKFFTPIPTYSLGFTKFMDGP